MTPGEMPPNPTQPQHGYLDTSQKTPCQTLSPFGAAKTVYLRKHLAAGKKIKSILTTLLGYKVFD